MPKYFMPSLNGYKARYLKNDLLSGLVVAALTIPVAMGYAQVAGLPPVYGLYASVLPVIGYALFASSPQLIFGIDASASAITSTILVALGIAAASDQAISTAALLSFFTAIFLILFAVLRLGRFASFISFPVMSGFISGVSLSIIIGQIPKVMGIDSSGTDFFANIQNIVTEFTQTNLISLVMGVITLAVILVCKKLLPKIPTALIMLVVGTAVTAIFQLQQQNVVITGDIPSGFPPIGLPDFSSVSNWATTVLGSLVIAVVIFADSLLTTNSFAMQGNYRVRDNQELFAFGISNALSSLISASPTSASVSRTAANIQYKGKSQLVSVFAAVVVVLVILFLAAPLYYMPQPVLSAITISALVGVVDIKVMRMLFRRSRMEVIIWLAAALGVLLVGVLFGVIVGVALSFIDVIIRATKPPQAFLGVIDGKTGYYDMSRHLDAHEVQQGIAIYRFTSALFFANIRVFKKGIESALKRGAKAIIVDASGIGSIDISAVQDLQDVVKELASGMGGLKEACFLNMKNTSFTITAEVEVAKGATDGVIFAQGGRFGGYALYVKDGKPTFCYNFVSMNRYYARAEKPLTDERNQIKVDFKYDGGGFGKGGELTLSVNNEVWATGRVDNTMGFFYSFDETVEVGKFSATPVTEDFTVKGSAFQGKIYSVNIKTYD